MPDIFDWNSTAGNNTNCDGIDIQTNMSIANIDNVFRSMMAIIRNTFTSALKNFLAGVSALPVANGGTGAVTLTGLLKGNGTDPVTAIALDGSQDKFLRGDGTFGAPLESFICKITDDATAVTAGAGKFYFDFPYAFHIVSVSASLAQPQLSGSPFLVDINKDGVSILSTRISIDNTEISSSTASTQPVVSIADMATNSRIVIDIDSVGDGNAKGLTVTIVGRRSS